MGMEDGRTGGKESVSTPRERNIQHNMPKRRIQGVVAGGARPKNGRAVMLYPALAIVVCYVCQFCLCLFFFPPTFTIHDGETDDRIGMTAAMQLFALLVDEVVLCAGFAFAYPATEQLQSNVAVTTDVDTNKASAL